MRLAPIPGRKTRGRKGATHMVRLLKIIFFLLLIGALGLVGYAYLGDLSPEQSDVSEPVELDAN